MNYVFEYVKQPISWVFEYFREKRHEAELQEIRNRVEQAIKEQDEKAAAKMRKDQQEKKRIAKSAWKACKNVESPRGDRLEFEEVYSDSVSFIVRAFVHNDVIITGAFETSGRPLYLKWYYIPLANDFQPNNGRRFYRFDRSQSVHQYARRLTEYKTNAESEMAEPHARYLEISEYLLNNYKNPKRNTKKCTIRFIDNPIAPRLTADAETNT